MKYAVADRLVFKKLRQVFGGNVRYFVTGAAPIPRKILDFFWGAGLPIFEVYGMTEATVITHVNRMGAVRLGSVGKPLDFVQDSLAEDGEILVRGKTVFQGYYKAPEATAEAIDADGWLHTGDIGKRDADGYLFIVDRKKHIIITAGGKNLTPANIENEIKHQDPIISHVHAHGDTRAYVTAIVSVSPLETIEWAKQKGIAPDDASVERMQRALMQNPLAHPEGLDELMHAATSHAELRQRIAEAVAPRQPEAVSAWSRSSASTCSTASSRWNKTRSRRRSRSSARTSRRSLRPFSTSCTRTPAFGIIVTEK